MALGDLISRPITGVEPFNELPIDAEVWREAHGQHSMHRMLHAVSAHRPGIVYGLEVFPSQSRDRTVVVAPGVAVDGEGRAVLLSEPATFVLEEKGQIYFTLSFEANVDSRSAIEVGEGTKHFRVVEGRQVVATKDLPKTSFIELARIDRSGKDKPVSEPKNPFDPEEDELSLLYRTLAFPHCYADGTVGELVLLPSSNPGAWKPNRAGLYNMLREANGSGFHLSFGGPFNLRFAGGANDPLILYVACKGSFQPLSSDQTDGLKRYLSNGGTIFAEAIDGEQGFLDSFQEIVSAVGAR